MQDLPVEEAGIRAEALAHSTTAPTTTSDDGNMTSRPVLEIDSLGTEPSSLARPGGNGNKAIEARGGDSDPVVDDQSQVLSKIKKLQDELVKVERNARMGKKLEDIESRWDSEFDSMGSDAEKQGWMRFQQMRAESYVKDTTAFAIGREWVHESEESFIWNMLEREEHDKRLTERRRQWEARKGITQPELDDPLKPARLQPNPPPGPYRPPAFPAFLDPLSIESRFNSTVEAQGYDSRERQLRMQMHEIVRQKHEAFLRWRGRPMLAPPTPANTIDVWPKPVVNYVQWGTFRYCSPFGAFLSEQKKNLFAIDALDGEPDLTATKESYDLAMPSLQNEGSKMPAAIPKVAQGLVPERIRLNGPQFAQTIYALGCVYYSAARTQMVLLQPYRLLVYLDKDIRKRHADLKAKLEVPSDQKGKHSRGNPMEPGYHETAQNDAEQVPHGSTETGAELFQKVEMSTDSGDEAHGAIQNDRAEETQQQSEDNASVTSGTTSSSDNSEESEESNFPLASTKAALADLGCLIDFMDTTISIRRNYIQGAECRKIHFRDLWYLFNPGDEVVRRDGKQVYRVIGVTNATHRASSRNIFFDFDDDDHSKYFQVSCVFVDFDGKKIGPVSTKFAIKAFAGERSVESLEVYPLRLHRDTTDHEKNGQPTRSGPQTLRQQLIKRGKKFIEAARMKLENTFYNGTTADGEEVESQVVVDFETALSSDDNFDEGLVPQLESLVGEADDILVVNDDWGGRIGCMASCCQGDFVCDDDFVDEKRRGEYIDSLIPKSTYAKLPSVAIYPRTLDDTTGDNALTDEEFLLMSYRVFAFVLRTRKWAELDLTYMEDATKSDAQIYGNKVTQPAFDQLVLPEGHKNIVLSLISQHYRNRDSGRRGIEQSDIVRGKGKGLILLLHGAPGVGKTSTAEGIAEKFKKPLFTITCGDLGSTAKEVEQALDLNFNLANRWGCILLLDEADVFLSSRTEADFERNGLVAVFLRVLEYYAGILFLTTNRVGVIDEAFRSRIHISLYYPPLGYDETRAVFKLNLKLVEDRFRNDKRNIKIERDEIIDFALDYFRTNDKARWNGRQIRNACQTALALAEFKAQGGDHDTVLDPNADVCLAVDNFKTVSKAYLEFTKYLKQLYGIHEDVRAKELGLRARETGRQSQAQSAQPSVFGGNNTQPSPFYSQAQTYNNAPANPIQTGHGQSYQSGSTIGPVHMNPSVGIQQPGQQFAYYSNPPQMAPASSFTTHGASGQAPLGQVPQQSQDFLGMQFQPAQGNVNQPAQPWLGPASLPSSATVPHSPSAQAQQQYQAQVQQGSGAAHPGGLMPTSQPFQAQQSMAAQQPMQQQQQQQAPQAWYPNMNVQNMQPSAGQNPPGPSSQ